MRPLAAGLACPYVADRPNRGTALGSGSLAGTLANVPADVQDAALALVLALGAEAEVLIRGANDRATLILVALGGLSLLAPRRAPWVMVGMFLFALLRRTLIVSGEDSDVVVLAAVVVAYSLGAHLPGRESCLALGVLAVAIWRPGGDLPVRGGACAGRDPAVWTPLAGRPRTQLSSRDDG